MYLHVHVHIQYICILCACSSVAFLSQHTSQVYTRLNHVGVLVSYTATLAAVSEISALHKVPVHDWLRQGLDVKFVGDNVDKKKGVRDLRSDKKGGMTHMYSMLVVKSRVSSTGLSITGSCSDFRSLQPADLLPTTSDLHTMRRNLITLVSRVLCTYITALQPFSSVVTAHITHQYSKQMAQKSDVHVIDVLLKNEAKHSDMIDILLHQHSFITDDFPDGHKLLSGGDQLTCERQVGAQRQRMDGDTAREKLRLVEPQVEDWHTLMTFLSVSIYLYMCKITYIHLHAYIRRSQT